MVKKIDQKTTDIYPSIGLPAKCRSTIKTSCGGEGGPVTKGKVDPFLGDNAKNHRKNSITSVCSRPSFYRI